MLFEHVRLEVCEVRCHTLRDSLRISFSPNLTFSFILNLHFKRGAWPDRETSNALLSRTLLQAISTV